MDWSETRKRGTQEIGKNECQRVIHPKQMNEQMKKNCVRDEQSHDKEMVGIRG